jgi:hypothetical protein
MSSLYEQSSLYEHLSHLSKAGDWQDDYLLIAAVDGEESLCATGAGVMIGSLNLLYFTKHALEPQMTDVIISIIPSSARYEKGTRRKLQDQ